MFSLFLVLSSLPKTKLLLSTGPLVDGWPVESREGQGGPFGSGSRRAGEDRGDGEGEEGRREEEGRGREEEGRRGQAGGEETGGRGREEEEGVREGVEGCGKSALSIKDRCNLRQLTSSHAV